VVLKPELVVDELGLVLYPHMEALAAQAVLHHHAFE